MGADELRDPDALFRASPIVRTAQVAFDTANPVDEIVQALGPGPFAMVSLFVTAKANFADISRSAARRFTGAVVMACTTSGELDETGYAQDMIVAIALPRTHFCAQPVLIPDLDALNQQDLISDLIRTRSVLASDEPKWTNEFAFLAIDGLSIKEDELVAAISSGLGPVPLFGGSAGDGNRFVQTFVSLSGEVYSHAAVLCFVRTNCPIRVFSLDHLCPTTTRMVVTEADPKKRIVRRINAEPAAREYARLLGKDPEQLSSFTFAANPVVVRFGETHHVRAIQRVLENDDMVFFSAIDEGLVLTLAESEDMGAHLKRELDAIAQKTRPDVIFACDCMLRRVEAQQKQKTHELSNIMAQHRVVGFSTYGEQINGMHVNQTMTGVAIYPPEADA